MGRKNTWQYPLQEKSENQANRTRNHNGQTSKPWLAFGIHGINIWNFYAPLQVAKQYSTWNEQTLEP